MDNSPELTTAPKNAEPAEPVNPRLPQRPRWDPVPVRRLRAMDDPEILELVLAGLLSLP